MFFYLQQIHTLLFLRSTIIKANFLIELKRVLPKDLHYLQLNFTNQGQMVRDINFGHACF